MNTANIKDCCAICVTYNPRISLLEQVVGATRPQVDRIYVVDNGSSNFNRVNDFSNDCVIIINLEHNFGIAYALNTGIKFAIESKYKYALMLDQDSIPTKGMVRRYLEVMHELSNSGNCVGAIGPRYMNQAMGNISRFVRFNWFYNKYCGNDDEKPIVHSDFLITSGSFYHLSIFKKVGLFNESFFIDHVDTEWCNRATSKGFKIFGVWDVVMNHSLGERGLRLWFFRWRFHPIHKSFRLYFIMRNSILMYRMPHNSLKWISGDIFRLIRLSIVYSFFIGSRVDNIKNLVKGFIDGLKGVTGGINMIK